MRKLTTAERNVLAYVVISPDAWWEHANKPERKVPAETALALKVKRWKLIRDVEKRKLGRAYKTRADKVAEGLS